MEIITNNNRKYTHALKYHPEVIGSNRHNVLAAGVADMDFEVAPEITSACQTKIEMSPSCPI